jgi:hypothetical protein
MEFADIGAHCAAPLCALRDFLPGRCDDCGLTFCAAHKSRPDPACRAAAPSASSSSSSSSTSSSSVGPRHHCTHPRCTGTEAVALVCALCSRNYCFAHRDAAAHGCSGASASGAPAPAGRALAATAAASSSSAAAPARQAPATSAASGSAAPARPISEKNAALLAKVRLMKVKSKTQANPAIPEAHRFFLEVTSPSSPSSSSPIYVCADGREPLGRVLDLAAKQMKLPNPNSSTSDPERRLHLFVVVDGGDGQGGRSAPLALDATPGELERGGILQNGGALLLRLGLG